ncbi:MAG: sulfatase-like hydrolase/transferase [Planctomycetes bacterium]|nr:sulfatase-like hydrolase/transferase [Planctomycetota bacterium]
MTKKPNVLIILTDQLRASALPPYETQVDLPNLAKLQKNSVEMTNALSTCPLCTPARGMMMTGRHPQSNGMIINFSSIRSDEIGIADAFSHAGYRTGYVGKWHLHRGAFPSEAVDFIPEGRVRLGWDYWRAYNCHVDFWEGHVNGEDWHTKQWEGYETEGLLDYAQEFLDQDDDSPWLMCVAPHQPHWNWKDTCAPEEAYAQVPMDIEVPNSVPDYARKEANKQYREYMAMIVAIDRMIERVLKMVGEDTLVLFTSDHGTMMGGQSYPGEDNCWGKVRPHEESISIPAYFHWPQHLQPGSCDELFTHVDLFPTLCGFAGIPVPRSVEGVDMSAQIQGSKKESARDAALIMGFHNYCVSPNFIEADGNEWRGVRTRTHTLVRWSDGGFQMYDNIKDPGQLKNIYGTGDPIEAELNEQLDTLLAQRGDDLHPHSHYRDWVDQERRVVKNAWGPMSHPDTMPDWSLLSE